VAKEVMLLMDLVFDGCCFCCCAIWHSSSSSAFEEAGGGVEGRVSPLLEVNALEDTAFAGHARVDLVIGQHHGINLQIFAFKTSPRFVRIFKRDVNGTF